MSAAGRGEGERLREGEAEWGRVPAAAAGPHATHWVGGPARRAAARTAKGTRRCSRPLRARQRPEDDDFQLVDHGAVRSRLIPEQRTTPLVKNDKGEIRFAGGHAIVHGPIECGYCQNYYPVISGSFRACPYGKVPCFQRVGSAVAAEHVAKAMGGKTRRTFVRRAPGPNGTCRLMRFRRHGCVAKDPRAPAQAGRQLSLKSGWFNVRNKQTGESPSLQLAAVEFAMLR